jgi:hypothetical protein
MASPNGLSLGLLAAVFDLPASVEPPVARGERRERRGRVRTGESERGEWAVRRIMVRFLEAPRRLLPFSTRATFPPPPPALASAWPRKNGRVERSRQAKFFRHLGCFKNRAMQGIFFHLGYQTTIFWPNSCEPAIVVNQPGMHKKGVCGRRK